MNGKLIYKRWLNTGQSVVIDKQVFNRYTDFSINDFDLSKTPEFVIIKAKLTLLKTEDGGRKTGIKSGYRPDHVFEFQNNGIFKYAFTGDVQFPNINTILPGEKKIVTVRFLIHQPIDEYLTIGRKWWMVEGPKKIGEAEVLEVTIPKTEK